MSLFYSHLLYFNPPPTFFLMEWGCFCFGYTPSCFQGLYLALCWGITPGRAQGSYRVSGIKPGSVVWKASTLPSVVLLQPQVLLSLIVEEAVGRDHFPREFCRQIPLSSSTQVAGRTWNPWFLMAAYAPHSTSGGLRHKPHTALSHPIRPFQTKVSRLPDKSLHLRIISSP